jgi:hypothetical protein
MAEEKSPHPGHENHLCHLQNIGFLLKDWEGYKKLVKNPQYICRGCGRLAASDKSLCLPEKL